MMAVKSKNKAKATIAELCFFLFSWPWFDLGWSWIIMVDYGSQLSLHIQPSLAINQEKTKIELKYQKKEEEKTR